MKRRIFTRRNSAKLLCSFILAASAASLLPVRAATVTSTWTNAASGNWNVDANWTNSPLLGGFPNNGNGGVATYDAVINAVGANYTVTLGTSITIEAFTLSSANATVNQTAGTFTANAGFTLSAGTFQMSGGTVSNTTINVSGTGSLVIAANANNLLTGVTVNGDLNLTATSAVTKIAGGTTFTTAHLAFDQERNYPLPHLFVSMLQRMGLETDRFATSTGTMRGLEMS